MLTMLGSQRQFCDGKTRRETLKVGALSVLGGFGLPQFLQADQQREHVWNGKAKSVICLYLLGGAPWQDMYDMKPNAPSEVRGEFNPIATNAPGIEICEHLPPARQMDGSFGHCPLDQSPSRVSQLHPQLYGLGSAGNESGRSERNTPAEHGFSV